MENAVQIASLHCVLARLWLRRAVLHWRERGHHLRAEAVRMLTQMPRLTSPGDDPYEFCAYTLKRPMESKDLRICFFMEIFAKLRYTSRDSSVHFDVRTTLTSQTTRLINEQESLNEYRSDDDCVTDVVLAERTIKDVFPVNTEVYAEPIIDVIKRLIQDDTCRMKIIMHLGYLHGMRMFRNLKECDSCKIVISEYARCEVCTVAAKRVRRD